MTIEGRAQAERLSASDYGYGANDNVTSKTTYGIGASGSSGSIANTYTYAEAGQMMPLHGPQSWHSYPRERGARDAAGLGTTDA